MLQVVRAVVHGIFIRPSELAIWFYTMYLADFSVRSRRKIECYTTATMLQHASRTEAAEVSISIEAVLASRDQLLRRLSGPRHKHTQIMALWRGVSLCYALPRLLSVVNSWAALGMPFFSVCLCHIHTYLAPGTLLRKYSNVASSLVCTCVGVLVYWCIGLCVHWGLALSHHQRGTDFAPCDVCGSPYLCPPSTSARVRNRFEFVELGRDTSSNCTKCHWDYRLVE